MGVIIEYSIEKDGQTRPRRIKQVGYRCSLPGLAEFAADQPHGFQPPISMLSVTATRTLKNNHVRWGFKSDTPQKRKRVFSVFFV